MIHHVTFCSSTMTRSAEICSRSALEFGCDSSWVVHYDDLKSTEFYWDNLDILTQERGAGLLAMEAIHYTANDATG